MVSRTRSSGSSTTSPEGCLEVAARQVEPELAALGLVPAPLLEPGAHDVQLGLAHRALEPEQQPVVVERRVVDAVAVGDQRAGQGADLEQLVPVAAGPGEPRHLEPEHQADMAEPDLGHQALEARPALGRGAGAAEVVVDDADARPRPAQPAGALGEPVLQRRRLAMLLELLQRGLADVDDGQPVKMAGLDLARQHQARLVASDGAFMGRLRFWPGFIDGRRRRARRPIRTASLRRLAEGISDQDGIVRAGSRASTVHRHPARQCQQRVGADDNLRSLPPLQRFREQGSHRPVPS